MNYRVIWNSRAQQRLASIWLVAPDRAAVTAASHQIDVSLERDPFAASESRHGNVRVLLADPLGVYFVVNEAQHLVTVKAVWHRTQRP